MTNLKSYGLLEIKSTSRTGQVRDKNGDICRAGGRYHTFHVALLQDKDEGGVSGKYHYITLALATGTIAYGTLGIGVYCVFMFAMFV